MLQPESRGSDKNICYKKVREENHHHSLLRKIIENQK